jgi:NDP-sugar pyrophosphorylase family protein
MTDQIGARWPQFLVRPEADSHADLLVGDSAVILAGGEGTRLATSGDPAITSMPKLLVEILPDGPGGEPIAMLDHVIRELSRSGFGRVAVVTAPSQRYGDAISLHLMRLNLPIAPTIIRESEQRGTGRAACTALDHLYSSEIIILPGDIIFPFHCLNLAMRAHLAARCALTWIVTTYSDPGMQNFGRIILDVDNGCIAMALEGDPISDRRKRQREVDIVGTSAGVIVMSSQPSRELLKQYITAHPQAYRFELYSDFIPWVIGEGIKVGYFDIACQVHDLGTPDRLEMFRFK